MRFENLEELTTALMNLGSVSNSKKAASAALTIWLAGFTEAHPPTQVQIDEQIAALGMSDVQTAFDNAKDIFQNPEIIPANVLPEE